MHYTIVNFNIVEAGHGTRDLNRASPKLSDDYLQGILPEEIGLENIDRIVEINIRGYTHALANRGSPSPARFFGERNRGRMSVVEYRTNKNHTAYRHYREQGHERIDILGQIQIVSPLERDLDDFLDNFRDAILYQHGGRVGIDGQFKREINEQFQQVGREQGPFTHSAPRYQALIGDMSLFIRNNIPRNMINHEHEFNAVLDGLLTALSDLKLFRGEYDREINIVVVPEFQVGGGRRVDLAIQTIERIERGGHISYNNGVLILLELKFYNNRAAAGRFLNTEYHTRNTLPIRVNIGEEQLRDTEENIERIRGGRIENLEQGQFVRLEGRENRYRVQGRNLINTGERLREQDVLLRDGDLCNIQLSQLISYLRSKNLKALTDGWEVAILPMAFILDDNTIPIGGNGHRHNIDVPRDNQQNPLFILGPVVHSSLENVRVEQLDDPLRNRLGMGR